ncbi:MAG: hypothetical protein Q7S72_00160 [Candidatus Taylorbacteria bacterium]|nr:hypothetical protein [Candidatus Taylorbacteria bacterium]
MDEEKKTDSVKNQSGEVSNHNVPDFMGRCKHDMVKVFCFPCCNNEIVQTMVEEKIERENNIIKSL